MIILFDKQHFQTTYTYSKVIIFQVANILYLESPAGSGYSYARTQRAFETSDTKQIHQIDKFLRIVKWFFFLIFFFFVDVFFFLMIFLIWFLFSEVFYSDFTCSGLWITLSLYRIHFTLVEIHIPGKLFQELYNRFHLVFFSYQLCSFRSICIFF